jgi:hypothetical protein
VDTCIDADHPASTAGSGSDNVMASASISARTPRRHREVRRVVADVDVPEHRDVALPQHVEDDLAERVRPALGGLDLERGTDDHARDSVEHAGVPQRV